MNENANKVTDLNMLMTTTHACIIYILNWREYIVRNVSENEWHDKWRNCQVKCIQSRLKYKVE